MAKKTKRRQEEEISRWVQEGGSIAETESANKL